jgi:hypothetical protein
VAKAIIEDWRDRPARKPSGDPWVITLELGVHLSKEGETELRQLLNAAGIDFDFNQVFEGGKIKRQRNYIHLFRMEEP